MKSNLYLNRVAFFVLAASGVLVSTAQAHPGHGASGFAHGVFHPISGWDHMLAMIAVGMWATQLATTNKRALWAVPGAFVGVMALGGVLGMSGLHLAGSEVWIVTSVLVLGVLIAAAVRLPLAASMALVGAFAMIHGLAHGSEMPVAATGLSYGVGFIFATVLLHVAGIGAALGAKQIFTAKPTLALRFAGTAIALGGVLLAVWG